MKQTQVTLDSIQKMIQKLHEAGYYSRLGLMELLHVSGVRINRIVPMIHDTRLSYGMNGRPVTYYNAAEARRLLERMNRAMNPGTININSINDIPTKRMIIQERIAKDELIGTVVTVLDNDTNEVIKKGILELYNMMGFIVAGETFCHTSSELHSASRIKELDL